MKYLKKFNESVTNDGDLELIDDYLLEYVDKYGLGTEKDYETKILDNEVAHKGSWSYTGYYKIEYVSTTYFGRTGFPNHKSGYLINIVFIDKPSIIHNTEMDKIVREGWKEDMLKFITRVKQLGYKCTTTGSDYGESYYIAFFK